MIKDIATFALCIALLFSLYCLIYFVTAAFTATGTGVIKWGEGWAALIEHLQKLLSYVGISR